MKEKYNNINIVTVLS